MLYSDRELVRWWDEMARHHKALLMGKIKDRATNTDWGLRIYKKFCSGESFTPKELQAIRNWDEQD